MGAPEDLRRLASNGLRRLRPASLRGAEERRQSSIQLDALRLFRGKSLEEVREIAFEIGMLGQHGRDEIDRRETHVRRGLPGRSSRRWSCCASCTVDSSRSSRGWISEWILWRVVGDGGEAEG